MGMAGHDHHLHVLIVDDMEINVDILANIIDEIGYVPLRAQSVEEALRIIGKILPQLILLDVSMPHMDGYELIAILKKNPITRNIPVIFISAMDSLQDKLRGLELGAVDFITKPFEATEVTMRVKNQMETYRMKKELETFNHRLHKMLTEQARKIENEKKELLCSLARLAEKRSGVPKSHLDNIGYNSRILAQGLQLTAPYEREISEEFIESIEVAAKLHDLGKLWVGAEASPAAHTEIGVEILTELLDNGPQSDFIGITLDVIRFHHADWRDNADGIPLAARIVRIADDFSRFTDEAATDSLAAGLAKIKAGSGREYDPAMVAVFLKISRQLKQEAKC